MAKCKTTTNNTMIPIILHLFGPFYIRSYGTCIALGLILVIWLAERDTKRVGLLDDNQFITLILWSIVSALLGGRLLYLIANWGSIANMQEILYLWNGGFSVLGSIIGVIGSVTWYAKRQRLSPPAILDFFAVYAPLLQSISRLGCFFAGCCYGKSTLWPLSISYHHPDSIAPLHIPLHPAQLYSSLALFFIYLTLTTYAKKYKRCAPGRLIALYLLLVSLERFLLDYVRADNEFFNFSFLHFFSIHQWLAIFIFSATLGYFLFVAYTNNYESV
jgi:phosphatidylglycerol---prolipoprotein diacylglyceryl transferase